MVNNIYLVGFMCSGKSTIGKLLAEKFNLKFVDIDEEIEREEGKKIRDIFSQEGEAYFRKLEREKIQEFSKKKGFVISTGGGLGADLENMNLMKKTGVVIWFKVSLEEVKKRCGKDTERPMLQISEEELKKLFKSREEIYRLADITVEVDRKKPEEILRELEFLIKLIER